MRTNICLMALLCSILIPSGVGHAQMDRVKLGVQARVSKDATTREGKVTRVARDSVWLSRGGAEMAMPLKTADSVWVRQSEARRAGWFGATMGALALGGFTALMASGLCDSGDCSSAAPSGFLIGGLIGGGAGAALGVLGGSLAKSWHRVVPRR